MHMHMAMQGRVEAAIDTNLVMERLSPMPTRLVKGRQLERQSGAQ